MEASFAQRDARLTSLENRYEELRTAMAADKAYRETLHRDISVQVGLQRARHVAFRNHLDAQNPALARGRDMLMAMMAEESSEDSGP
ncbi:hypothetical protein KIPB_007037 [Kipferlia bialata]|uniref:Uncharacterized protein n=1 Tax=Kipferlia bialata TaxID=797122 RepID=A0A391NNF4_9EUKA|nr:hypothetical protein KIPB_004252 [Kipferlia bialata]GCA62965.1 hypothetical protein KIPB_007037 [Kipferlia bialata]|eukprot:g4252.t1